MDLSIIVPIYNVENYLEECLESIYSIKGLKKEIILVNDGSTDGSKFIIDKYKNKYNEETIVINQENKGLSSARNEGIKISKGKYIAFIDSDDYIDSDKFEHFVKKCIDLNLDICFGELNYIQDNIICEYERIKKRMNKMSNFPIMTGLEYWENSLDKSTDSIRVEVVTNLYKLKFLRDNKLIFKEGLLHEDTLFMFQAISKCKYVKYLPYNFYYYRMRSGSIMKTLSKKNYIHKMYIAKELQNIKEAQNINLFSWDTLIISLYFSGIKNYKMKNMELYNRIKRNKKLTLKSRLKKLLISAYQLKSDETKLMI